MLSLEEKAKIISKEELAQIRNDIERGKKNLAEKVGLRTHDLVTIGFHNILLRLLDYIDLLLKENARLKRSLE